MRKQLFLLSFVVLSIGAFAQSGHSDSAADDIMSELKNAAVPDSLSTRFAADAGGATPPEYDSMLQQKHEQVFWYTFNQNRRTFEWQYTSSIIIFCVVMLVVLMGLYLSYIQFRLQSKLMSTPRKAGETADNNALLEMSKTNLELGKEGIKMNSAVIGLIILTLSLSFLFLYLKYVYPITIVKIN